MQLLSPLPRLARRTQPQPAQQQDMQANPPCPEGATTTATGEPCSSDSSAAAPAMQDQSSDTAAAPTDQPADNATAAAPATAPDATTTGSLPSTGDTNAAQADKAQPESTDMVAEQERGKFIDEQADDTVLASELMGLTVYNQSDEALGDVNDIAWKEDGSVDAVIVGVGGFLGIGEKDVAVAYEAINVTTDENGDRKLVLDASEDDLANAPEFVTTADKTAMLRQQQDQSAQPATGGGMAPAPVTPPAQQ